MTRSLPEQSLCDAVRRLYVEGAPIRRICEDAGIDGWQLYRILDETPGGPLPRRRPRRAVAEHPPAAGGSGAPAAPAPADPDAALPVAVVRRLWRAADRQVGEIERRLDAPGDTPPDAERDARALAVLARVARELTAADAAAVRRGRIPATADEEAEDDDAAPRDPELLRAVLAERIDQLRQTGSAAPRPRRPDAG